MLRNTSATPCTLTGFPAVRLQLRGTALAQPAVHGQASTQSLTLAPGSSGHAQLKVSTACNAPRSDEVWVSVPGDPVPLTAPIALPGCAMSVDAVTAG